MNRSFRSNYSASQPARRRADTALSAAARLPSPSPAPMSRLCEVQKFWARAEREHVIRKALDAATRTIPGARWREDKPLLATVVNLTEFPSVILGSFDPEFLDLPEEVLVTVMRDHQKYFAIEDANGKLLPHFLAVLNTDADSEWIDPARQRTGAARPFQRCPLFLADGPEANSAPARRSAAQRHFPKRSWQLLRQDSARATHGPAGLPRS